MAKLNVKFAPMAAGKSLDAMRAAFNYEERGMAVAVFKPSVDTRSSDIHSRIGLSRDCGCIAPNDKLVDIIPTDVKVIIIDEAQFLTESQVDQLRFFTYELDIPVICYGLKTDFQSHLFEGSRRLLEIGDTFENIISICKCGSKASQNVRQSNGVPVFSGEQVMIGGNESYEAYCNKCFYHLTK